MIDAHLYSLTKRPGDTRRLVPTTTTKKKKKKIFFFFFFFLSRRGQCLPACLLVSDFLADDALDLEGRWDG
eukprot:5863362-Prymnesium_polylepis.1